MGQCSSLYHSEMLLSDKLLTDDENVEIDEELEDFARHLGVTWEEFTNVDCNLATTTMTIADNWEENLLASCRAEDNYVGFSDEGEEEGNISSPVIPPRVAVYHLQELKEFHYFIKMKNY